MVRNKYKLSTSFIYEFLFKFDILFEYHFQLSFLAIICQDLFISKTSQYIPMYLINNIY